MFVVVVVVVDDDVHLIDRILDYTKELSAEEQWKKDVKLDS